MSQENVEKLRSTSSAWAAGDFASSLDLYASGVRHTAFTDGPVQCEGRDAVVAFMREFLREWDRYWIEVDQVEEIGPDHVLLSGRQFGAGKRSGIEIEAPLTVIWRFDGGQVVESHWHPERNGAFEAAGLSE